MFGHEYMKPLNQFGGGIKSLTSFLMFAERFKACPSLRSPCPPPRRAAKEDCFLCPWCQWDTQGTEALASVEGPLDKLTTYLQ